MGRAGRNRALQRHDIDTEARSVLLRGKGGKQRLIPIGRPAVGALDAYLDAPKTDWNAAYAKAVAKGQGKADEAWAKHQAARDKRSTPSLA